VEKLVADSKTFHKACFRCSKCAGVLKLGSYAAMEGVFFCKPCFKKHFFTKGNYSAGFGKLTPQQEHAQKTGNATNVGFSTISFQGVQKANNTPTPTRNPSKSVDQGSFKVHRRTLSNETIKEHSARMGKEEEEEQVQVQVQTETEEQKPEINVNVDKVEQKNAKKEERRRRDEKRERKRSSTTEDGTKR